jgi:hypothetical protein
VVLLKLQEPPSHHLPVYVTANTLVIDNVTLKGALLIARNAGAGSFELRKAEEVLRCNDALDMYAGE